VIALAHRLSARHFNNFLYAWLILWDHASKAR